MDYTVHGILQARILEWVAFSRGSSQPGVKPRTLTLQMDFLPAEPPGKPKNTGVGSLSRLQRIFPTCIAGRFFTTELPGKSSDCSTKLFLLTCSCYCSVTKSCLTLCDPVSCSPAGFLVCHYFPKFAQIHVHRVSDANHLILCHLLLLLPSVFPSIRVFSSESALHFMCLKYWSFSISLSNEYSGFISFKIDWFDLAVAGLKHKVFIF